MTADSSIPIAEDPEVKAASAIPDSVEPTDQKPSWDEAASHEDNNLPTWDEAAAKSDNTSDISAFAQAHNPLKMLTAQGRLELNAAQQEWTTRQPFWNVMKAFGQGWSDEASPENLQDLGKDWADNQNDIHKGLVNGIMLPTAKRLYDDAQGAYNLALNPIIGGLDVAAVQAGKELGLNSSEAPVSESMEALGGDFGLFHTPLPREVAVPKANVVLEGEGEFFGTKEPSLDQQDAIRSAANMYPDAHTINTEAEPVALPDIHAVARQIDPETFEKFDQLQHETEIMRGALNTLKEGQKADEDIPANAPHTQEISDLQDKLEDASARNAKRYQQQIDDLTEKNNTWIDQQRRAETPEMFSLRASIQKNFESMADIAYTGKIKAAYEEAAKQSPPAEENKYPNEATAIVQQVSEKPTESPVSVRSPDEEYAAIVQAASKKLVDAGRPQEESDAAAQLIADHYKTISEQGWAKGSPEEIYNKHAADIQGKNIDRKGVNGILTRTRTGFKNIISLGQNADASTFVHELGHHWLEEMMEFSEKEGASDSIKGHANTVRKWLGAEEGAEITRGQHEKFARGFEKYLMEGIAPSKSLAKVFGQFKQWLTSIYGTLGKLRSPINDDIRNVFDRLLSSNPEREAAIAPEAEAPAPPADTPPVPEAPPPSLTGGTEPPEENAETPTIQSSEEASAIAPPDTKEIGNKGDSSAPLGEPQSDLVDKAGNIRVENLSTPEDISQVIRDTAKKNGDFLDQRRGVIPVDEQLRLSDALGMSAKTLDMRKIGQAFNAEEVLAARKLLVQSAIRVRDLMKKAATGSDEDLLEYAKAKAQHQMIQGHVSGITAEAGRALAAFRKLEGSEEAAQTNNILQRITGQTDSGVDLFQLRREARAGAALDDAGQVSKFINDTKKPSLGNQILEYFINNLISGPATHTTYAVGNELLALWKAIPETAVASIVGKVHEALGGESAGVQLGEVGAQVKARIRAIPTGLIAAGEALKTGVTTLLPGEEPTNIPMQDSATFAEHGKMPNDLATWHDVGASLYGTMKGLKDGFRSLGADISADAPLFEKVTSPLGSIPDVKVKGLTVPIGSTIRVPGRVIAAIHSFFRATDYSMEKAATGYRTATQEGLQGDDFAARVADVVTNPSEEMMANWRDKSTNLTLMGKGGTFTQAVSRLTNVSVNLPVLGETKLLKFVDPFVKIGANVMSESLLKRTPIGLLSSEIRADLSGANGLEARDFAQARMIVGTAVGTLAGGLASAGLISGSGPSDPGHSAMWRLAGNQAHSIKIGNNWYQINRLGPLGMLLGVAADMHDVAHSMSNGDATKVASMFVHSVAQNVLDESFMRGPSELIKALDDSDRYGEAYIKNFASSSIPFSVGMAQEARAIDPYTRQTRTVMDAIKSKIPYVSESLMPKRDIWGEAIPNRAALGPPGLSAIYTTKANNDPVNQTLLRLGMGPAQTERKIRSVDLNDQQYDDYTRIAGRLAKQRLNNIVAQPSFNAIPADRQIDIIKKTIDASRENARKYVMMKYPEVMQQAVAIKRGLVKK